MEIELFDGTIADIQSDGKFYYDDTLLWVINTNFFTDEEQEKIFSYISKRLILMNSVVIKEDILMSLKLTELVEVIKDISVFCRKIKYGY